LTREFRCPQCHEPLGTVVYWTYQRRPCSRLTLNRRATSIDRHGTHEVIHCVCGGKQTFNGGETRSIRKP
jgi:hypothetical protein